MSIISELKDFQVESVEWMRKQEKKNGGGMLLLDQGLGKCHSFDTPILMFDGTIKMVQDIKEGEFLMGDDSTPRKVLSLARGSDLMYDIIPVKGDKYTVNKEHILCLKISGKPLIYKEKDNSVVRWFENNKYKTKSFKIKDEAINFMNDIKQQEIMEIAVKDYLKLSNLMKSRLMGYRTSIDFPEKQIDLDPYMIGFWLGDGSSNGPEITTQDSTIIKYFKENLGKYKCYLQFKDDKNSKENKYTYRINGDGTGNHFLNCLRKYDLLNNKHIPMIYKCNSRENRLKLLAGLLDSDGSLVDDGCTFDFSQKSEKLIDDMIYLCRSLGFACYKSKQKKGCWYKSEYKEDDYYRICISGYTNEILTLCPRKKANPRRQIKDVLVSGITVKEIGYDNYYGFEIDNNRRYVMGDFTVTHNTLISLALTVKERTTTLIICPAGLIDNWVNEINKHTTLRKLDYVKYYGSGRMENINNDALIYITSYSIISREYLGGDIFMKNSLFNKINPGRIILDEAHYIRNPYTNVTKSIFSLGEKQYESYKWILTGTPVFNNENDIYSYFKFLGFEGVDSKKDWTEMISKNINSYKKLNEWIKKYSISLKKTDVLKELKSKIEIDLNLDFNNVEKEFYESLKTYSQLRMKRLVKRIDRLNRPMFEDQEMKRLLRANVMTYILRLKQACNSPYLILKNMKRLNGSKDLSDAVERLKFFNENKSEEYECPICYDTTADYQADPCGHKCCKKCWDTLEKMGRLECPICRGYIDDIKFDGLIESKEKMEINIGDLNDSVKIQKVIELTKSAIKKGEKIIIVSQWVSYLHIIKIVIEKELPGIKYISLQGNIQMKQRTESIRKFESDTSIKVCFLSLMSSSEGITLVSANNLVFMDKWWNKSKMIQCADRIHRIGQIKQVKIYNLGIKDSIEEKIEELLNKKLRISKLVLNKWDIKDISTYDDSWIKNVIKLLDNEEPEELPVKDTAN